MPDYSKIEFSWVTFCFILLVASAAGAMDQMHIPKRDLIRELSEEPVLIDPQKYVEPHQIFVYSGDEARLGGLWKSVEIIVNFTQEEDSLYTLYHNTNMTVLMAEVEAGTAFFGIMRSFQLYRQTHLPPFARTFIAVCTDKPYRIHLRIARIDYKLAALFFLGIFLFCNGKRLARNSAFYYSSGVSLGLVTSLLVVFFIISRLLPRRSLGASVLLGGWSFGFYAMYYVWLNVADIMMRYSRFVAVYIMTIALLTFGFLYWLGPPSRRSLDLSQWALQLLGIFCMFYSCQISEITALCVLATVIFYLVPRERISKFLSLKFYRYFPKKRRLLTEDEYQQEAIIETRKALQELRQYCHSPTCAAWKTVSRLSSPVRFAQFVEGDCHLSTDEVLNYEVEEFELPSDNDDDDPILTEDSDSTEEKPAVDDHWQNSTPLQTERRFVKSKSHFTTGNNSFAGYEAAKSSGCHETSARDHRFHSVTESAGSSSWRKQQLRSAGGKRGKSTVRSPLIAAEQSRFNSIPVTSRRAIANGSTTLAHSIHNHTVDHESELSEDED